MSAQYARRVSLLEAAPELGANLSDRARTLAERALEVDVIALDPGPWEPSREDPGSGHLGMLVLDGLMSRELTVAGARSLELLNNGDLLRPWEEEAASFVEARWVALQPVRLAVLDRELAARLGRFPDLVEALIGCAMHRSRTLAVYSAIENMPRLEDRLLLVFWQMAERWGTRRGGGVHMPIRLTHQMLADLVGARRPSVSTALGRLRDAGSLENDPNGGWLLRGEAPGPHHPPLPHHHAR